MERKSWNETWMTVAKTIAERSPDEKIKVGAIIVSEDNTQVLSIGYNGNYKGGPNKRDSYEPGCSGLVHAEVNALIKCDFNFHKRKIMYITHAPCLQCAKLIVNAHIDKVYYLEDYRDMSGVSLLKKTNVQIFKLTDEGNSFT